MEIPVVGNQSGGTSAVAGLIDKMGIFMGNRFVAPDQRYCTYEDIEFLRLPVGDKKELIKQRNKEYDKWGWKHPETIGQLKELVQVMHNPHVVVVGRDPVAIARSKQNRWGLPGLQAFEEMRDNCQRFKNILLSSYPSHFVSFEKLVTNTEEEIRALAKFCEVDLEEEDLKELKNFIGK